MANLIEREWQGLDLAELMLLLKMRIVGPGQYDGRDKNRNAFYLPQARSLCQVKLKFKGKKIIAVEPGPAFDLAEWNQIRREVETALLSGAPKVGREYSFCTYRANGWWRGTRSGVQIVPPPEDAPRASLEGGDHPFILEFPLKTSALQEITKQRRIRVHRKLTLLLNVLLRGHTSFQLPRSRHLWATDLDHGFESKWVYESFFANLGPTVIDSPSEIKGERVEEVEPHEYYASVGHDGQGLRVPSDLDDSICRYLDLTSANRAKFDRAAFWFDMSSRLSTTSVSAAFACLVSAIESLTERGATHLVYCAKCGRESSHDAPGATETFRTFLEKYAPGRGHKKQRDEMYSLRSGILHGRDLMEIDQDITFGWDPPGWNELELSRELSSVTRTAMRNWLRESQNQPDSGEETPLGRDENSMDLGGVAYSSIGVLAGIVGIRLLRYLRQKYSH